MQGVIITIPHNQTLLTVVCVTMLYEAMDTHLYIYNYVHADWSTNVAMYILHTVPELQYQPPPTCPANYVPRVELLSKISSAILNSDITPTIGTTVTIRGIGGIGKSTIAKALCHDPLIKEHFINGFLWISLTSPLPSAMTVLSEIYQRLTDKSTTSNVSVMITKLKSLLSNPSCKLLVVLDDVSEAKDAMMFVDIFSSCKIVLTTRKMNINAKIPPMACFDVTPMSVDEAVKLLTLNIFELETLCANDMNKIQKLARDLHCWPLLLNLVHGQLYVHCIEWSESPQDVIVKVQQKLCDSGLTAFDPENQLEASRENAVRASITASLELLTKDEEVVLLYIASSIIGFGVYTIKDFLSTVLEMDTKQFDKCTRNLWCHGLISFQDVTFPNVVTKIPCIGIHEVIAHYINENMPDEFYLKVTNKTLKAFHSVFFEKYFFTDEAISIGQLFICQVDAILIPFWIRFSMIRTKYLQILVLQILDELAEKKVQLLQNDDFFPTNRFPSVKHIHKVIEQDCKSIHSLLADGKHNEAMTWAKQYFDNHPHKITWETVITYFNSLLDSCKSNISDLGISVIENCICFCSKEFTSFNLLQRHTMLNIIAYNHVLYLMDAGASDNDIKHYLLCLTLLSY